MQSQKITLQPTAKSISKPKNAKPHYEPSFNQQAKRPVPLKQNFPKKSVVAPASIISGAELDELRSLKPTKQITEREM